MGWVPARLSAFSVVVGILLVACAPSQLYPSSEVAGARNATTSATPPSGAATGTATAGTALPAEVQALQQQIVDVHRDMLQVLRQLSTLDPERQREVSELMVDLMAEMGQFMASLQPAFDLMTPEERQEAAGNLGRMADDIQGMHQLMPEGTSGPGPRMGSRGTPGAEPTRQEEMPGMGQMGQLMDELHRQIATHMSQMDLSQIQGMAAYMVDMMGNLNRLKEVMGPALSRISLEQRQALKQRMDRMQAIVQQMKQLAGLPESLTPTVP